MSFHYGIKKRERKTDKKIERTVSKALIAYLIINIKLIMICFKKVM